jgi:hypothetical protein
MKNVFDKLVAEEFIGRVKKLDSHQSPEWGKMTVGQMLAHCNVAYELVYEDKHPKPNAIVKFMLKLFVKETVVGDKPFKKNGQTAPAFKVTETKDFEVEKVRLIEYIRKTQELGGLHFDGKESHSFGVLSEKQWSNSFSKHLDHHLSQFGV